MTQTGAVRAEGDPRWRRLAALSFDDDAAAFSFSQRLARDNAWSHDYATRVVEEYKRFAFLACAAGREVTPSDEVDQAWHLHLTYTRHYWGPFAEALGAPLHHNPTAGGTSEKNRYADNYEATLKAYEAFFGAPPPSDIWPAANIRFSDAPFMQRINRRRNFVLPKGKTLPIVGAAAAGAALTASVAAQDVGDQASDILSFFNENPVIGYGGVVVVILILLMLIRGLAGGRRKDKSGGCGGAVGGGAAGGKSGGKGKDSADGDGSSGCSSGCGGCGGG